MFAVILSALLATAFDAEMSVEEMKQTGIERLSAQEKTALQKWVDTHYSKNIAQYGSKKKQGASLEENLNNGHYIRLTDNSLWEINPVDTPITQGWITPVEIKVSPNSDPVYPTTLTNTLTGSSVKARKVEKVPTQKMAPKTPS
jgi:hypothetical protein